MNGEQKSRQELFRENQKLLNQVSDLRTQLNESHQALRALHEGRVEGLIVPGEQGEQVFTAQGAERIYRRLIEEMQEGALALSKDGCILYANRAVEHMLGVPLEKITGSSIQGYIHADDMHTFEAIIQEAGVSSARGKLHLAGTGGNNVPVYFSIAPVQLEPEMAYVAVITDLTEHQQNEQIAASERLLRSVLEQAVDAIIVCDPSGRVIRANQAACKICGSNPLRRPFGEAVKLELTQNDQSASTLAFPLTEIMEGKTIQSAEGYCTRPDGTVVNVLVGARPLQGFESHGYGCFVTMTDISGLKQAENELREIKEDMAAVVESSPLAIFTLDREGKVQKLWNSAAERMFGWKRQSVMGRRLPIVPRDRQEELDGVLGRIFRGEYVSSFETVRQRKDGSVIEMSISAAPIKDEKGNIIEVMGIVEEITQRRQREQELKRSEQTFKSLFNSSGDAMFIHLPEGRFVEVNQEACRRLGYTRQELLQLTPADVDSPQYSDRVRERTKEIMEKGGAAFETEHVTKQGRIIPTQIISRMIDYYGQKVVLSAARDFSQRKQYENHIQRLNDVLEVLREINQFTIKETDPYQLLQAVCSELTRNSLYFGAWTAFKDTDQKLRLGAASCVEGFENSITEKLANGYVPPCVQKAMQEQKVVVCSGSESAGCELPPSRCPARTRMAYRLAENGDTNGVVVVCTRLEYISPEEQRLLVEMADDVVLGLRKIKLENERKQALETLHRTQQQVVEQERYRALSQMASGIAHDFNNALSTIMGFTDLMLQMPETLNDTEKVKRNLELISKSARNAAAIVRRMRKFYRPREDEKLSVVDLNQQVEEAVSATEPRWKQVARSRGVDIFIEKDLGNIEPVGGNEHELQEMLTNLIFNAVDAMPEGGTLRFRTRQEQQEVLLEVSDTGVGMPEDVRRKCFDPFFTTKGESGTGLGLSTVQGIVTRHKGRITVDSEEGQGTCFRIYLPVSSFKKKDRLFIEGKPEDTARSLKILVVEDSPDQRHLLGELLQMDHHYPEMATDGREGLNKFNAGWYDVVITDRAMPGMSGDEFAGMVKSIVPRKLVIMLTGFGEMMDAAGEKPGSVDLVISKPVTIQKLRNAIDKVMGHE
ncbi:MAG: PAS domain S-box protein [Spirochaetota bacterium]